VIDVFNPTIQSSWRLHPKASLCNNRQRVQQIVTVTTLLERMDRPHFDQSARGALLGKYTFDPVGVVVVPLKASRVEGVVRSVVGVEGAVLDVVVGLVVCAVVCVVVVVSRRECIPSFCRIARSALDIHTRCRDCIRVLLMRLLEILQFPDGIKHSIVRMTHGCCVYQRCHLSRMSVSVTF